MKHTTNYKLLVSLCFALLCWTLSFSQAFGQSRKENIETLKIGFLTQRLGLSPEEAQHFWPVYNLYQSEMDAVREERKKVRKTSKEDFSEMTDTELEKLVDGEIGYKQRELDVQKKYHAQFKKVLPVRKVAMLYKAEEDFKKELLRRLQEQKGK